MFAKPYKVKSNTSLKNSEKKHLIQRILEEFPSVTEEQAKQLVPAKSSCSCMKVALHSGEAADVFVVDGAPALLAARGALLPALPALWRLPHLLPALTIQTPVLAKLQGGAPLYLPGVALPAGGAGFPMFARGARLAVRTTDNAAAAAVGFASLASGEMLLKVGGACLEVVHWTGDMLCREAKFNKLERPRLAPPGPPGPPAAGAGDVSDRLADNLRQMHVKPPVEQWPSLVRAPPPAPGPAPAPAPASAPAAAPAQAPAPTPAHSVHSDPSHTSVETEEIEEREEPGEGKGEDGDQIPSDPDELLQWVLLGFLKLHAKTVELPIKTSLLYRNYLLPLCPPDRTLDVKKSSYKKVGKFLEAMQKEGLLEVREVEKGVEAVTALHAAHPRVRAHTHAHAPHAHTQPAGDAGGEGGEDYSPPRVRELLAVTAHVLDLFAPLKKGTTLTTSEVRARLTEYVKTRNLTQHKGAVTLDDTLARAANAQPQESMRWEALMSAVSARCTPCTEMEFADGTRTLTRARLEPIKMQVVNRSGNKKVTLVSNLEAFGFSLAELARAWQRGAAAACGVTRAPGAKHDQLLLQGDQTYFVARVLIEKYGLPKKFVEGADKALKKKKGT